MGLLSLSIKNLFPSLPFPSQDCPAPCWYNPAFLASLLGSCYYRDRGRRGSKDANRAGSCMWGKKEGNRTPEGSNKQSLSEEKESESTKGKGHKPMATGAGQEIKQ
jgi:hypothetical protein